MVVEVESGGGLTNLVKYWPLAAERSKPLLLVHVFALQSDGDYLSHRLLWEFLYSRMAGPGFHAWLFTYRHDTNEPIVAPLAQFEICLTAPLAALAQNSMEQDCNKTSESPQKT